MIDTRTAAIVGLACLILGCGESPARRQAREQAEKPIHLDGAREVEDERVERAVAELGAPYKADMTWSTLPFLWTADLQDRLVRRDKLPIAGVAKFLDISRDGDAYLLHLRHADWPVALLDLVLKTARREAPVGGRSGLAEIGGEKFAGLVEADYVFVARVIRVRRQDVVRDGVVYRRWIAEGDCVDLRALPPPPKTEGVGKRR